MRMRISCILRTFSHFVPKYTKYAFKWPIRKLQQNTHHMFLYSIFFADSESDSESDSSDHDVDDGGGFDAEHLVDFPIQPEHEDLD